MLAHVQPACARQGLRCARCTCPPQVEQRGTFRGGYYDTNRSRIQAMKEIKVGGPFVFRTPVSGTTAPP